MTWLALLQLVLKLSVSLASYMKDKQLIDAGIAEEALKGTQATLAAIERARQAVEHMDDDPAHDPHNHLGP